MGTHRATVTITDLVPNERIVYESEEDTGRYRHYLQIAPANGSVELTKGVEPLKPALLFRLLSPLLPLIVSRALNADLQKIKAILEG